MVIFLNQKVQKRPLFQRQPNRTVAYRYSSKSRPPALPKTGHLQRLLSNSQGDMKKQQKVTDVERSSVTMKWAPNIILKQTKLCGCLSGFVFTFLTHKLLLLPYVNSNREANAQNN